MLADFHGVAAEELNSRHRALSGGLELDDLKRAVAGSEGQLVVDGEDGTGGRVAFSPASRVPT